MQVLNWNFQLVIGKCVHYRIAATSCFNIISALFLREKKMKRASLIKKSALECRAAAEVNVIWLWSFMTFIDWKLCFFLHLVLHWKFGIWWILLSVDCGQTRPNVEWTGPSRLEFDPNSWTWGPTRTYLNQFWTLGARSKIGFIWVYKINFGLLIWLKFMSDSKMF